MSYEPDDSAERVSRYRRHEKGDHSQCLYQSCQPRRDMEYQNEAHLLAVAALEALAERGIDAEEWFGDGYGEARNWPAPSHLITRRKSRIRLPGYRPGTLLIPRDPSFFLKP